MVLFTNSIENYLIEYVMKVQSNINVDHVVIVTYQHTDAPAKYIRNAIKTSTKTTVVRSNDFHKIKHVFAQLTQKSRIIIIPDYYTSVNDVVYLFTHYATQCRGMHQPIVINVIQSSINNSTFADYLALSLNRALYNVVTTATTRNGVSWIYYYSQNNRYQIPTNIYWQPEILYAVYQPATNMQFVDYSKKYRKYKTKYLQLRDSIGI